MIDVLSVDSKKTDSTALFNPNAADISSFSKACNMQIFQCVGQQLANTLLRSMFTICLIIVNKCNMETA